MRGYSVDLRERAVEAVVVDGLSQGAAAAKRLGLSRASVGCYVRAWQAGAESLAAGKRTGRPCKLRLPEHRAAVRESFEREPDLALAERAERLAQSEGLFLGASTLWRTMRRLGITRKKRR